MECGDSKSPTVEGSQSLSNSEFTKDDQMTAMETDPYDEDQVYMMPYNNVIIVTNVVHVSMLSCYLTTCIHVHGYM